MKSLTIIIFSLLCASAALRESSAAPLDLSHVTKADIIATVEHLQRNEKATQDQLFTVQTELTASQISVKTVQAAADKLQGERDWWQADDAKQVWYKEVAQEDAQRFQDKAAKIAAEFHKLLFACASLIAALAVLLVLQLLPVTFVPPPYRWYVAAGVGAVTFAASWAILSHL